MGTKKGQNNFKSFQQGKIEKAGIRIAACLKQIKKGMVFETLGSLALYVAGEVKLNRTTIQRNPKYIQLIRDSFYKQPGITKFIKDKDTTLEIEQEKNFAFQTKLKNREIEISNLKNQNLQLTRIIEKIGQPQVSTLISSKSTPREIKEISAGKLQPADTAFADTAQALLDLMKAIELKEVGIHLDYKNNQIIDTIEVGEKSVIVASNRCCWFFEWLDMQSKLKLNTVADFDES